MVISNLNIRPATVKDEEAVYDMICDLEDKELDRESFNNVFHTNLSQERIRYLIAELDGEPVGMGSCHTQLLLHHVCMVAEIQEMYVSPQHRSKEIGKALVEKLIDFAKSKNAQQIEVTSNNMRENAHRFYQKEGFKKSHVKLVRYF
ncbi:GNAT family N-acetyltransferase [Dyadobacter sp. CY356]|uniref:GNAT family N-acetyltransferase n=1 Tax=Dyadobacter sp. CY356 TaxID=2906442 RepID=UPI001F48A4DE|nr:GNAT family N-acetyltransferase [Dyadobacter sp. CY356]MCF0057253.1 GNAT family N-acetyltransferase [Dyadobacter sp. CY356]